MPDVASRLTSPEDFSGDVCQLEKDSHEGPYFTCAPAPGKAIAADQAGQPLTVAMRLLDQECSKEISRGMLSTMKLANSTNC